MQSKKNKQMFKFDIEKNFINVIIFLRCYMTRNEIVTFIKNFNREQAFSSEFIVDVMRSLSKEEGEIFMQLVNYKNGKDFLKKLNSGEI